MSADSMLFDLILQARDEATATIRDVGAALDGLRAAASGLGKMGFGFDGGASEEMAASLERAHAESGLLAEGLGAVRERADGVVESFRGIAEHAAGFAAGALGYSAIMETVGGIEALGKGLIETNATAEQLTQTMAAIYHSGAEAQDAVSWITQFALAAPFTRQSIMQASVTIAALGQDITQVIPALGNLASVMGTDMPTAAQAFMDAYEGRFQMMQRDLHVSKQQLQEYGLEISNTGKIVASTLAPAFERFVAANYPNAMSLQMHTFNGQMSNLEDQLQNVERIVGHGVFEALKGEMFDLIGYLQSHQGAVNAFAATLGDGLGAAAHVLFTGLRDVVSILPQAVNLIANLGAAASGPAAAIGTLLGDGLHAYVTYLQDTILPLVETAIGTIIDWWDTYGQDVLDDLNTIGTDFVHFLAFLQSNATSDLGVLQGVWQVAWSLMSGVFLATLDLLSGKWANFGDDLQNMIGGAMVGVVTIVEGGSEIAIRTLENLLPAMNTALHGLYDLNKEIGDAIFAVFVGVEVAVLKMLNGLIQKADQLIGSLKNVPGLQAFGYLAGDKAIPDIDIKKTVLGTRSFLENGGQDALLNAILPGLGSLLGSGLPADKQLTFRNSQDTALAGLKTTADGIKAAIESHMTRSQARQYDAAASRAKGQETLQQWLDELKKLTHGGGLKLDWTAAKGLMPYGGNLPVPGLTGGDGTGSGTSAVQTLTTALTNLRDKLDYDLLMKAPRATLQSDLAGVLTAMKKGGSGVYEVDLERATEQQRIDALFTKAAKTAATQGKKDDTRHLDAARMQFDYDRLQNAPRTKLLADISTILGLMKKAGDSRLQVNYEQATLLAEIDKTTKTANAKLPGAAHSYYGDTTRALPGAGASYGQTIASFGAIRDTATETIAMLRQQLQAAQQQITHLREQVTLLTEMRDSNRLIATELRRPVVGGPARPFARAGVPLPAGR